MLHKILLKYEIACYQCKKPFLLKDLSDHEGKCSQPKCENDLCTQIIADKAAAIKFTINGGDKFACSKKCKKVAKFSYIL